jgi:hypothetical protein
MSTTVNHPSHYETIMAQEFTSNRGLLSTNQNINSKKKILGNGEILFFLQKSSKATY